MKIVNLKASTSRIEACGNAYEIAYGLWFPSAEFDETFVQKNNQYKLNIDAFLAFCWHSGFFSSSSSDSILLENVAGQ